MSYIAQLFGIEEEKVWTAILAFFLYSALNAPAFLVFQWWREIKATTLWLATLPGADHVSFGFIILTALVVSCKIIDLAAAQQKGGSND